MTVSRRYGIALIMYVVGATAGVAAAMQSDEPVTALPATGDAAVQAETRMTGPLSPHRAIAAEVSAAPNVLIAQQSTAPTETGPGAPAGEAAAAPAEDQPQAPAAATETATETTQAKPAATPQQGKKREYASVEEELAPQPELGPRTLYDISPEAREIRSKELLAKSNRPMAPVPDEVKKMLHQSGMAVSPMSLRDIFNWMTWKLKAKKGVKFEDVVEAMDLKANELNFKKVGHNPLWKDVGAITGRPTTRVEVFSYCDAIVGRKMMDISPEFSVWIPCRITVYEDYNGDIWLMTLDWDVTWLQYAAHPDSKISKELYEDGIRIRDIMAKIMRAGAEGAW